MARTKNRGMNFASSPTSNKMMRWRLGKYIRLSKEDLLRGRDESNSVVNQRLLLEQYHQTHMDEFYEGTKAMCMSMTAKPGQILTVRIFKDCWPMFTAGKSTA